MTRATAGRTRREAIVASALLTGLLLARPCRAEATVAEPSPSAPAATAAAERSAGAAPSPSAAPAPPTRSERIGSVGKHFRQRSLFVSRSLDRLAWVDAREERCRVVVDRSFGAWHARCTNPLLSPDGGTVVYFASEKVEEAPAVRLVVDGQASPVEVGNEGPVAFAEHGKAWAAIAPARATPPVADAPTPSGAPPRRMIAFSPAGVLGEYHDTTAPVISPDGVHVAFVASDSAGNQRLVVDGRVARDFGSPKVEFIPVVKQGRPLPNLEPEAMVRFLSDGSLAGIALGENGWSVFHGDETWASYPGIRLPESTGFEVTGSPLLDRPAVMGGSLVAAAKAPVACWWQRRDGGVEHWQVVCNGKPVDDQLCNAPSPGQPITVTPDGKSVMYVCEIVAEPGPDGQVDPKNLWVVVDGGKRGPHRFVWGLELTPDGRHHAFAAADGVDDTWFYELDGKRFDGPWQHAFPPTISPDGKSIAWAASAQADGKRVDLVRDGVLATRGDIVMAPPRWTGDTVEFAIRRGHSVRRVVID
jgi:hypothetical protein